MYYLKISYMHIVLIHVIFKKTGFNDLANIS